MCWAMGLTQHRNAVATIREIVNFLLLRGNIGRPGAGAAPIRGHSNVQGDRTMGIWEKMPDAFLDALGAEFGFDPPRAIGYDTVDAIRAMRDGKVDVFVALGGNFAAATPDSDVTAAALANCGLTVHVSTKLNRSHLCARPRGADPAVPGPHRTRRAREGRAVRDRRGLDGHGARLARQASLPGRPTLRSEVAIVTALGDALFGADLGWRADGRGLPPGAHAHRAVVPGFDDFESRVTAPGGFALPNGPRDCRTFRTASGKARFTVNPPTAVEVPAGHLLLQTVRSHDQFNTTVYGLDDRYRGINGGRRVVFVHADDLAGFGLRDGDLVDLVSIWDDGERRASGFRAVAYPTPRGCAAAYFPEANVLVPLDSAADGSNTPTSKSIVIRLEAAG